MVFVSWAFFTFLVTELGGPPHAQTRGLRGHIEINILRFERDKGREEQSCFQSQLLSELKQVTISQYSVPYLNYLTQKSLFIKKGQTQLLSTLL